MGRKPLQPNDRKVNVTLRLAPYELRKLDEALGYMNLVREFIAGMAPIFEIPENRTDIITYAIVYGLPQIAFPFRDMATKLIQVDLNNEEDFQIAVDEFNKRWPANSQRQAILGSIVAARQQKQKAMRDENRIKELEDQVDEMKKLLGKGK